MTAEGSQDLEKEGWTRAFVADEPRLGEAVRLYEEAGFEVRLVPLPPVEPGSPPASCDGQCRECFRGFEHLYKIIYTRPRKETG